VFVLIAEIHKKHRRIGIPYYIDLKSFLFELLSPLLLEVIAEIDSFLGYTWLPHQTPNLHGILAGHSLSLPPDFIILQLCFQKYFSLVYGIPKVTS
jgi:hypothetical protein